MRKQKLADQKPRSAFHIDCRLTASDNLEMDVEGRDRAGRSDNHEL